MAKEHRPEELGQPIPHDPDFDGPLKHRSCTDIICLLLFMVFIGCWVGVAIYAFTSGDPNTLLVPKDSYGSRCGLDSHVRDKPYLFFFNLTKCFSPTVPFTGCPTKQVCVEKCPKEYFFYKDESSNYTKLICDYDAADQLTASTAPDLVDKGLCAKWYLDSSSLLNRCLYNIGDRNPVKGNIAKINSDDILNIKRQLNAFKMWIDLVTHNLIGSFTKNERWQQVGQNVVDDLISSWWQILIGVGIAVVICIIYIVMMRWLATILVWLSLIGVVVLLVAAVYFTAAKYVELKNDVEEETNNNVLESILTKRDTWLVLLIISCILLGIVLLMLIFLRKRILLAIALIKEGSKAVSSVTSVLFFPIFPWVLQIGVIAFSIAVALYLSTTGDPLYEVRNLNQECPCSANYANKAVCVPDEFKEGFKECWNAEQCNKNITCKFITMQNPASYPYLQVFNVFAFFWGTFFVSATGQMILASVFATWYWTSKKSNLPFFAVTEAIFRTLRYHIGTLAFGSLIITICRIIRVMLEYVDQKLKKYDNGLTKAILCCCKCFFWCLESFLKFINRNAYIMCAIHGKNFCASAKDAFMLLMRNIIRVWVLDKVTDFLFFLGKLLITVGVGAIAYLIFATDITGLDNTALNYNIVPVIVIMICTYFIATVFFNVYSMAVDTLFLCFLEDCERNDGSINKPYYMSKNLMKIFGKKNKKD